MGKVATGDAVSGCIAIARIQSLGGKKKSFQSAAQGKMRADDREEISRKAAGGRSHLCASEDKRGTVPS